MPNAQCSRSSKKSNFFLLDKTRIWINSPLLVALTYADERLFSPDVLSLVPSICNTRDNETIVRKSSVTLISSLAEHSSTLALQFEFKIHFSMAFVRFSACRLSHTVAHINLIYLNFGSSQNTHSETSSICTSRCDEAKSSLLPAITIGISYANE